MIQPKGILSYSYHPAVDYLPTTTCPEVFYYTTAIDQLL